MFCISGGDENALLGVDITGWVGAGEIEENPTRSLILLPCEAETGFGAANCVLEVMLVVD